MFECLLFMDERSSLILLQRQIAQCTRCPRLVEHRQQAAETKRRVYQDWDYWSRPVPSFGDPNARVLAIGLAPAAHGGNRTGRMFTGDASARFLMDSLYEVGFASQHTSEHRDDGLTLHGMYLTAAARCAPPADRPSTEELANCASYLNRELDLLSHVRVVLVLGRIAFDAYLRLVLPGKARSGFAFRHGARYEVLAGAPVRYVSYHPSPRNHQTGRLTRESFVDVLQRAWQEAELG